MIGKMLALLGDVLVAFLCVLVEAGEGRLREGNGNGRRNR